MKIRKVFENVGYPSKEEIQKDYEVIKDILTPFYDMSLNIGLNFAYVNPDNHTDIKVKNVLFGDLDFAYNRKPNFYDICYFVCITSKADDLHEVSYIETPNYFGNDKYKLYSMSELSKNTFIDYSEILEIISSLKSYEKTFHIYTNVNLECVQIIFIKK